MQYEEDDGLSALRQAGQLGQFHIGGQYWSLSVTLYRFSTREYVVLSAY